MLVSAGSGYLLRLDPGALDADVVCERRSQAQRHRAAGDLERAAQSFDAALTLWRGEPLGGLCGPFAEVERTRLNELRLTLCEEHAELLLALGKHAELAVELPGLVQENPLREDLRSQLMLALYRSGRQAEALALFQDTRRTLVEELGIEPGLGLQRLHGQILAMDPALDLGGRAAADAAEVVADPARRGLDQAATELATVAGSDPGGALAVRYSLPLDTAAFTGRAGELGLISAAVTEAAVVGGVVAIHAIGGMPGVGKTALAVHAAHLLRGRFPDRQLFIDLHAHTPGQEPVSPEAALAGLLTAVGVDPRYLPGDLAGRAGLWRDRMAGQRALLVLDNAAGSAQVAPLLPGGDGCLVLVTSRRHLGDLPGPVAAVQVDALPPDQAQEMFARLAPRAAAGPAAAAVQELARLAGCLPLAISLLARVYAKHPSWTLADLTAETEASLLSLAAENDSVAAAFGVSYRYLPPARQQFFRRLGLHPGTTTDVYAAAALAGLPLPEAAGQLDALHGEGLLTEAGYRRYGLHDLIRRYARDLAADPAASGDQALGHLLDYYQHTAAIAEALLARQSRTRPAATACTAPPAAVPDLPDGIRALAWARAERGNLLACLDHVTRAGQHARVVALTAVVAALLRQDGPWADAVTRHGTAVQAARHLGDRLGHADALTNLGAARRLTGDYRGAAEALEAALGIYRSLGDRRGEANTLRVLGAVRRYTGDYRGAAEALGAALGIYRDLGDRLGEANALTDLGAVRRYTRDYRDAADALEAALGIYRDLGAPGGAAEALNELGTLHRVRGDLDQAGACHRQALDLARQIGSPWDEAHALAGLGRCALAADRTTDAVAGLRQAREIFHRIGAAEATGVAAELDALTGTGPAA